MINGIVLGIFKFYLENYIILKLEEIFGDYL